MKHIKLWLLLLFTVVLSGCAYSEIDKNLYNAEQLRVGMTKEQVQEIMGKALAEQFCTPDIWYYFVQVRWHDGLYTEDECIPMVFQDEVLIGWGNEFLARKRLIKPLEQSADKVSKHTGDSLKGERNATIKDTEKTISL